MLSHIHIRNFAIVEELELDFFQGMTCITGETGAGKSIVIDALELVLGKRVDGSVLRHNEQRCDITVSFDLQNIPAAQAWLSEHDLNSEADNECLLRRTINPDGRSRAFINGQASTLTQLRDLGSLLINIHGQHEHQLLLKRDKQRHLLDTYAGHIKLVKELRTCYQNWHNKQSQINQLQQANEERQHRLDLLRYQIQELNDLALQEGELASIEAEHKQLANAEQIIAQCQQSLNLISEEEGLNSLALLYQAQAQLVEQTHHDERLAATNELLNNAVIQTQEASNELRHYLDNINIDPERLRHLEQRLSLIHDLARKHHAEPEQLVELHQRLNAELNQLENCDEHIENLRDAIAKLSTEYDKLAHKLSASRKKAAKKLATAINQQMQTLGMTGGKFAIEFATLEKSQKAADGYERIEFTVSANPGQPLLPLNKVASGGELSRISLAIQAITAQRDDTPSLIFDEVDVGIGGGTAEVVGGLLRQLGERAQIICITHLPQVAAQGHYHYQVMKHTGATSTHSDIRLLDEAQRVEEIARMLGGVKITKNTLAHAKEMLS